MTAEIEAALEKLIEQHGIAAINDALEPLIMQFKWSDWQRVYNLVNRLNNRKRAKPGKSGKRRKSDAPK
jgi:hypothetical protein